MTVPALASAAPQHMLHHAAGCPWCRDPVSVKALTRKSRVDPGFRQEMWRLLNERHLERTGQGSAA